MNKNDNKYANKIANAFLKKALAEGAVKKVGGFSGHYIYQPASQ